MFRRAGGRGAGTGRGGSPAVVRGPNKRLSQAGRRQEPRGPSPPWCQLEGGPAEGLHMAALYAPGHLEEKAVPPGNSGHVGLPGAASALVPGAGSRQHGARLPAWVSRGSGPWGVQPGALSPPRGSPQGPWIWRFPAAPAEGGVGESPAWVPGLLGSGAGGSQPRSPLLTPWPCPSPPPQTQGVCRRGSPGP